MTDERDGRSKPRPGIDAQRESIREAAVSLFVEQGSQAVSIAQICARANISRPTFYRCFEDKQALIANLYQISIFEPVQRILLTELPSQGDDPLWLQRTLEKMLDAMFEQASAAELVFAESNNPGSPAFKIVNTAFDQAVGVIQLWLKQSDREPIPANLLKSVMAACQWLVHNAIRAGLSEQDRKEAKASTWLLISTLMTGLTA